MQSATRGSGWGPAGSAPASAWTCSTRPDSDLLTLSIVRKGPVPFPPEPLRSVGIQLTRRAIARADANQGRRGPWLRALDAVGLGFDS